MSVLPTLQQQHPCETLSLTFVVTLFFRRVFLPCQKGKDNAMFWQSQLRFDCPVPDSGNLRDAIASGESVLSDGTPSVYVDVVPIRTAARYGKGMSYFTPEMVSSDSEIRGRQNHPDLRRVISCSVA